MTEDNTTFTSAWKKQIKTLQLCATNEQIRQMEQNKHLIEGRLSVESFYRSLRADQQLELTQLSRATLLGFDELTKAVNSLYLESRATRRSLRTFLVINVGTLVGLILFTFWRT